VGRASLLEMSRHTTFRFCLDPNDEQQHLLTRHACAARFAFNQCLRIVKDALSARLTNPSVDVPWTGFDLINAFNSWKKTPDAGRVFVVGEHDLPCVMATGLTWRTEVCQQVFEEAAVDCGRALVAWSDSRKARRKGRRVGFPRFKKKGACRQAFRLRNKQIKGRRPAIRVGDDDRPRSITLPGIGSVRVHERHEAAAAHVDERPRANSVCNNQPPGWPLVVIAQCRGRRPSRRVPSFRSTMR